MTKIEKDLMNSLLLEVGQAGKTEFPDLKLTLFMASKGFKASGELMLIGRSANGWRDGWTPCEVSTQVARNRIIRGLIPTVENSRECPLKWVVDMWGNSNGYNTKKSSFWRVARLVLEQLNITKSENDDWSSYLHYSNLCKVSPYEGGNPSNRLCDMQWDYSVKLLAEEIDQWKPKRILFVTDKAWFDWFFSEDCGFELRNIKRRTGKVQILGQLRPVKSSHFSNFVVTVRPEGTTEQAYAKRVAQVFSLLDRPV